MGSVGISKESRMKPDMLYGLYCYAIVWAKSRAVDKIKKNQEDFRPIKERKKL